MSYVEFRPTTVSMDGGPCEARLPFNGGALVAAFICVPEGVAERRGWFREAGFSPCRDLFTKFSNLDQARDWISQKIAEHKSQS